MNHLWTIVVSNAIVATLLAIGATLVVRVWKNPAAIHVIWMFVLLKTIHPSAGEH